MQFSALVSRPSFARKSLAEIMKRNSSIILTILFTTIISCKNNITNEDAKNLSEYKGTQFIPTLEYNISDKNNSVYCATLLFAWDEIRKQVKDSIKILNSYKDLNMVNQSKSYVDVLNKDEYQVEVNITQLSVTAKAEFKKSLPFDYSMTSFSNKLKFYGEKVSSFGIIGHNDYSQLSQIEILYYRDDNNFIIKLIPEDKNHEIILFKTEQKYSNIAEMADTINHFIDARQIEIRDFKKRWRYDFKENDILIIPKINFDIETVYKTLEGNIFRTSKRDYKILKASQRTAFVFAANASDPLPGSVRQ